MRSNEQRIVAVANKEDKARQVTPKRCKSARRVKPDEQQLRDVSQQEE